MSEYYMFNKPRGCITARRDPRHKTVMDYFPAEKRDVLFPVGRLDKDTEGLLIVTDDGMLSISLMMPHNHVPKAYFFRAQGTLTSEEIAELERGVRPFAKSDKITAPAKIENLSISTLSAIKELLSPPDAKLAIRRPELPLVSGVITITEGKKHQVKRMLGYAGCRVVYLKRLSIGALNLDVQLAPGEYRPLTDAELLLLKSSN